MKNNRTQSQSQIQFKKTGAVDMFDTPVGGDLTPLKPFQQQTQQHNDSASNQSSGISSVKMSNFYSTEQSEDAKPSQFDMLAQRFSAQVSQRTEETAENQLSRREKKKRSMIKKMGTGILTKMLGQTKKMGLVEYGTIVSQVKQIGTGKSTKYTMDNIMQMIDADKLMMLRGKFFAKQKVEEDGFTLHEFVDLMRNVIPYKHPEEETDLVLGLSQLFKEIDINGNGQMEWDEFTGFLIEAVDQRQLSQAGTLASDEIVSQNALAQHILQLEESQPDYLHQNNMLQVARSQIYQEFHPSSTFKDTLVRNSPIIKAILYHGTDTFITLESNAKCVKFLTAMSNQAIPGLSDASATSTRVTQKVYLPLLGPSYILSVAFNEKDKIMALCSTDSLIYFYRCFGNQKDWKLFKIICSHGISCQVSMWYMPHHERWFSIGSQQQGNYSHKQISVGSIQTLHQWHIPRSKLLSNKQMNCPECQVFWNRSRGNQSSVNDTGEHQIERPFIEEFDEYGEKKVSEDAELRYLVEPFEHMNHRDDVKDVKEIYHPYLAIITACHDGKLRIISTVLRRAIGILHTGHMTGIRQIDYTPYHGASILSVGYECYFNLWEMDNSLSFGKQMQDQPTKFTLVSSPCIAARFLGQSVFAVAIDSLFTVKIWNYKKNLPMQSLQQTSLKMQDTITGLLTFSEGKFAILSKHVTFYDTIGSKLGDHGDGPQIGLTRKELEIRRMILQEKGLSEIQQAANQQRNSMINPPIDVHFLTSYQNFLVLTKDSLRVYNGNNGRLRMYLDNIVEEDEKTGHTSELSSMCLNSENRMVYIGDIHGGIRCFNVNTGLQIKKLELPPGMLRKQGEASVKINKEVCGMRFFTAAQECELLVSAHWNNRIRIWDVIDVEKATHMRSASAQEVFNEDIQCVAVSEHLSLIATGSMFGNVVVWDFELFKVEGVLIGSKMAIVALEFVKEYPLLVSASMCGIVSVYAVRGAPRRIKNHCLGRFLNVNRDFTTQKFMNTSITSMTLEVVANPRFDPTETKMGALGETIKFYNDQKELRERAEDPENAEMDVNWYTKTVFLSRLDKEIEEYTTIFNEGITINEDQQKSKATKTTKHVDPEEGTFRVDDYEAYYEKFYPPFSNCENPEFLNIVLSDEAGTIKWLDLTTFIRKPFGQEMPDEEQLATMQSNNTGTPAPCLGRAQRFSDSSMSVSSHIRKKIGTMPGRRMDLKAGSPAITQLEDAKRNPLPPLIVARKCVMLKHIMDAHRGRINQIRPINVKPYGYVTCGNDKFVRVWSQWGTKVGEINLIKEGTNLSNWRFGYDWQQKQIDEHDHANQIVQDLNLAIIKEKKEETEVDQESAASQKAYESRQTPKRKDQKEKDGATFITSIGGGPALTALVNGKPPDSDDERDALTQQTFNHIEATKLDPKKKSQNLKETRKQTEKWDVDRLFPIPPKYVPKPGELKHSEKQFVKKQTSQIDKAIKVNLPGVKNPFHSQKRKPQSQSALRGKTNSEIGKKSSLKIISGFKKQKHHNMQKSQISFQLDNNVRIDPNTEDNSKTLNSVQQEIKKQTNVASSTSSSGKGRVNSTSSAQSSSDMTLVTVSQVGSTHKKQPSYQSKAERKLDMKIHEIQHESFSRLNQLLQTDQTSTQRLKSGGNKAGNKYSNQHSDKASQETKSLHALEARIEKQSLQSHSSIGALRESTDQSQALREKQGILQPSGRSSDRRMTQQVIASADHKDAPGRQKKLLRASHTMENFPVIKPQPPQLTQQEQLEQLRLANAKQQVMDDAIQKTDDHMKELIDECSSRHQQMQEYIKIMKSSIVPPSKLKMSPNVKSNSMAADARLAARVPPKSKPQDITAQAKLVLQQVINKTEMWTSSAEAQQLRTTERVSQRPPRMMKANHQSLSQPKTRNSIANFDVPNRMPQSKSRILNKMDRYINESGSNPSLDQRFFMRGQMNRGSNSQADLHNGPHRAMNHSQQIKVSQSHQNLHFTTGDEGGEASTVGGQKRTAPNRLLPIKLKARQARQTAADDNTIATRNSTNNMSVKQGGHQSGDPMQPQASVRDVQRLIARHVSQKDFVRPDSGVKKLAIMGGHDWGRQEETGEQLVPQSTRGQTKLTAEHREAHLVAGPEAAGGHPKHHQSRVAKFLSKYTANAHLKDEEGAEAAAKIAGQVINERRPSAKNSKYHQRSNMLNKDLK